MSFQSDHKLSHRQRDVPLNEKAFDETNGDDHLPVQAEHEDHQEDLHKEDNADALEDSEVDAHKADTNELLDMHEADSQEAPAHEDGNQKEKDDDSDNERDWT